MTAVMRPPLRYHGGKWRLAPWIISHFPAHRTYVEPFAGGGSVLMRKARSYAEVYNDVWGEVVRVFRVLRDPVAAERLAQQIYLTPFAREEFEAATREPETDDDVEMARRAILRSLAGFGSASMNGTHATGFRSNSARSGTTPAHDWRNYPAHIALFTERLRGVVIECRPAVDVMLQQDGPETLHYVDPPYVTETRNMRRRNAAYAHDLTDDEHRSLAEVLHGLSGMIVLSGYASDLYDELYPTWTRYERPALADGAKARTEVLWLNPACETARSCDMFTEVTHDAQP